MKYLKILVVVFLISGSIVFAVDYNNTSCRFLVFTKSGEIIPAKKVNWYKSGFIDVRECDGEIYTFPQSSIDTVKEIK